MRGLRSGRAFTSLRRGAIGLVLVTLITPLLGVATAHAENYRFWGYYSWSGDGWQQSETGPASITPEDGDVEGWRFAISMDEPRPPRTDGEFDAICGQTPKKSGQKRIAVVLDYGLSEEAPGNEQTPKPRGECAAVPKQASSEQVLSTVAEVRAQDGLTCGVDGYPDRGCGDPVDKPANVQLPEPRVELQLPDTGDAESGQKRGSGDSDRGQSANGNAANDDQSARDADEQNAGIGGWAIVAIVLIVLIVGGAVITRVRGRNRAA